MPKAATSKAGWTTVAFGDVVRLSTERSSDPESAGFERFVGLEHIEPGDLRIRRWGDIADGTTFTSVFRPGQVLFGKRRAYQRKVAVADFSGVCSGDIYVLEPKGKNLLPELLPFICQTDAFFEHAVGTSAGSLSPRTNWASLSGFEFTLPPIEEQRRLVSALSAAWRLAEQYRAIRGRAAHVLDSLATSLLRQDHLRQLHADPNSPAPEGWRIVTFGDVCERITYGFTNPMPTTDEGPWMVTAADVRGGAIDYTTARRTSRLAFDNELTAKSRVSRGDVLLTKDGTLGRVAVVDRDDVCVNQSVAVLRPTDAIDSYFLAWTLRAPAMQRRLMLDVGGSAVKHLYITKIAATTMLCPSLPQQRRCVELLGSVELSVAQAAAREQSTRDLLGRILSSEHEETE